MIMYTDKEETEEGLYSELLINHIRRHISTPNQAVAISIDRWAILMAAFIEGQVLLCRERERVIFSKI